MHIIAIVSSIILMVGCFLPWLQIGAIFQNRGVDGLDGGILLTAGIISAAVSIYNQNKQENKLTWVYTVVGTLGLLIAFYDLSDAQGRAREATENFNDLRRAFGSTNDVSIWQFLGAGLYIVGFSSIGLILTGLGVFGNHQEIGKPDIDGVNTKLGQAETDSTKIARNNPFVAPEHIEDEEEPLIEEEPVVDELDPIEKRNREYQGQVKSLKELVENEKKAFLGAPNKDEIMSLLKELCTSKKNGLHLLNMYSTQFNTDLIEDLKSLSSSYRGIKEYVTPFIELGIVAVEHPHDRTKK